MLYFNQALNFFYLVFCFKFTFWVKIWCLRGIFVHMWPIYNTNHEICTSLIHILHSFLYFVNFIRSTNLFCGQKWLTALVLKYFSTRLYRSEEDKKNLKPKGIFAVVIIVVVQHCMSALCDCWWAGPLMNCMIALQRESCAHLLEISALKQRTKDAVTACVVYMYISMDVLCQ